MMIAIGVMLATSTSIGSINASNNETAGNMSKASNATLTPKSRWWRSFKCQQSNLRRSKGAWQFVIMN